MCKYPLYAQAIEVSGADWEDGRGILYVGSSGDVKVDMVGAGTGIVFKNVPAGTTLECVVKKVYSSGTTASDLVILEDAAV